VVQRDRATEPDLLVQLGPQELVAHEVLFGEVPAAGTGRALSNLAPQSP
jgi:hypothetical protein